MYIFKNQVSISLKVVLIRPEAWELQGKVCRVCRVWRVRSRQRHHQRRRRCLRPSAARIWKDLCFNIDLGMSWNILDDCFTLYASFGVLLRN